jgi:hypothetical protein
MDLVAIQMGLTVVLLIAHVLRVVRDRMSRSRDARTRDGWFSVQEWKAPWRESDAHEGCGWA